MKHFLFIFLLFLIFVDPVLAAAPSIPQNFEANISDTTVNISWVQSTDAENDTIVYTWVLVNSTGYENITHTVRNESMVLYTHFNDGTSTDWSLYGNNGTDTNISYVSEDKYGYAAEFNGIDSYINCGNDSTLDITDTITVEVLADTTNTIDFMDIISKSISIHEGYNLYYRLNSPFLRFRIENVSGDINCDVTTQYQDGNLHHIATTFDGTVIKIIVDGLEVGIKNYVGTIQSTLAGDLKLGISNNYAAYLEGKLHLVKIYNRTLSPVEINANSNIIAESASYNNFTGVISNLPYGDYHIIVNARDNSSYSNWSAVYNFSITQPHGLFKASFKIIDQYRSDLVYNIYVNGTYINDFDITDAYFVNSTNDTSIILTASQNYIDISNVNNVSNFIIGVMGFVLFVAFLFMAFKIGRGR